MYMSLCHVIAQFVTCRLFIQDLRTGIYGGPSDIWTGFLPSTLSLALPSQHSIDTLSYGR
jgi:hypothetical protein